MLVTAAAVYAAASLIAHGVTTLCAAARDPRRRRSTVQPAISLVMPLCGFEPFSVDVLDGVFGLKHWPLEVIFCVADPADPIVPVVQAWIAGYPHVSAQLLTGDDKITGNPKLNNLAKGVAAARCPWIAMVDSNVVMPRDYLASLFDAWTPEAGAVCAPLAVTQPENFAAAVECAIVNTHQLRWQRAAERFGAGFAQGKGILCRAALFGPDGVKALDEDAAEDIGLTRIVRRIGLRVLYADASSPQPLGRRSLRDVWRRQIRWARLRRRALPAIYAAEIAVGGLPVFGAAALAAPAIDVPAAAAAGLAAAWWYGSEIWLAVARRHPLGLGVVAGMVARDLALPVVWLAGWFGDRVEWRGNSMGVS